jgi:hypothetical protein
MNKHLKNLRRRVRWLAEDLGLVARPLERFPLVADVPDPEDVPYGFRWNHSSIAAVKLEE